MSKLEQVARAERKKWVQAALNVSATTETVGTIQVFDAMLSASIPTTGEKK